MLIPHIPEDHVRFVKQFECGEMRSKLTETLSWKEDECYTYGIFIFKSVAAKFS